jgi:hypothetical protein
LSVDINRLCAGKSYLIFAINGIATPSSVATAVLVAPAGSLLSVGTVARHVTCVAADTADDARSVVGLVGTVIFAMSDAAAVLAGLVLIVAEGTVEGGKFAKLVTLEFVLALWNGCGLVETRLGNASG